MSAESCSERGAENALTHVGEVAVGKGLLRRFHRRPIDSLGAHIVAVGEELALHRIRQRDRTRGAQISVGPDGLTLVRQQIIENLLRFCLVRSALYETDDVRKYHGSFAWDDEFKLALFGIFRAVGIEVVIEENRDLAGNDARVGGLLWHDRLVLLQVLEERHCRREILLRAAERQVDRDCAHIADRRGRGIEIADHPAIVVLEQILPAGGDRLAAEGVPVDEQAERSGMGGCAVLVPVVWAAGDLLPTLWLVRGHHCGFLRLYFGNYAVIA